MKLFTALAISLISFQAQAAVVAHAMVTDSTPTVSVTLDTSKGKFILVAVGCSYCQSYPIPKDSLMMSPTTLAGGNAAVSLYCYIAPQTSAAHKFTIINPGSGYDITIGVAVFDDAVVTTKDSAASADANTAPIAAGPVAAGDLTITAIGAFFLKPTAAAITVPGFTITDSSPYMGLAMAWAGASTAPLTPSWSGFEDSGYNPFHAVTASFTVASGGGTSVTVASGPPPAVPTSGTQPLVANNRMVAGWPFFPSNMWFNQPVNLLPADPQSAQKIATFGTDPSVRLGPSPEFYLNIVDNTTPVAATIWDSDQSTGDGGQWRITPNTILSNYIFGQDLKISQASGTGLPGDKSQLCASSGGGGSDSHILIFNKDTGIDFETWCTQSATPPYHSAIGVTWDLSDTRLRTATKPSFMGINGLTSADAAGFPIAPLVLRHSEVFSGTPITHGVRIAIARQYVTNDQWSWPATHYAGGANSTGIYMGTTFRLGAVFDTQTCHLNENTGKPYPAWFQQVLAMLKTYGAYYADTGTNGLISTDTDRGWGDTTLPTSDNYVFAGWLHCVPMSALEVVDNSPRVVNINDGAVKAFTIR